ncbi:hypothetical protein CSCA_1637 [Clostridium scatologenes]|uniref:Uncharacterized protein n=1 Tax=Clostridium scatologenes TaxID=1548 RepID=A0A0E3JYD1_CLOSL|nr:hypothetical protein CSCA_1637 [Clostridium scatologenes]
MGIKKTCPYGFLQQDRSVGVMLLYRLYKINMGYMMLSNIRNKGK